MSRSGLGKVSVCLCNERVCTCWFWVQYVMCMCGCGHAHGYQDGSQFTAPRKDSLSLGRSTMLLTSSFLEIRFFQEEHPLRVLLEPTFRVPASLPQDHHDPGWGTEWRLTTSWVVPGKSCALVQGCVAKRKESFWNSLRVAGWAGPDLHTPFFPAKNLLNSSRDLNKANYWSFGGGH